jgi:hypothetical protein
MNTEESTEESPTKELGLSQRGDPARTLPAEHIFRFWHHQISAAADPLWIERVDYWSGHTGKIGVGDFVFCETRERDWFAVVRVLGVRGDGLVVQGILGKDSLLRQPLPELKRGPPGTNEDDFTIEKSDEFIGKFCVVRKHDGLAMTRGQPFNKGQCVDWLRTHLVTVRPK